MKFAFFGSGEFAEGILRALVDAGLAPELVITAPPKPKGRGRKPKPTLVAILARERGIETLEPQNPNEERIVRRVRELDFIVLADYGKILKKELLEAPRVAPLNFHPSLLPRWRGAAPAERSIMAGDQLGLTLFVMDEGMDTGPVLLQREAELGPWPTKGDLFAWCFEVAPQMLLEAVEGLSSGRLSPKPQEGEPTYAPKLSKEELWLKPLDPARVARWANALSPKPGARVRLPDGRLLKILRALPSDEPVPPGELKVKGERLFWGCEGGSVEVLEVQLEGRRPLRAEEFLRGFRP